MQRRLARVSRWWTFEQVLLVSRTVRAQERGLIFKEYVRQTGGAAHDSPGEARPDSVDAEEIKELLPLSALDVMIKVRPVFKRR